MDAVVSTVGGLGPRGSQDETSPFPLEFMVARPLGHSQDETSPFPLDFVVVARKRRASQDETSPFPLEYEVTQLDGDEGAVRIQRRERPLAEPRRQPRRAVSEPEASASLRAYAARLAAGEALPPYRGPVLASEERARSVAGVEPAAAKPAVLRAGALEPGVSDPAESSSNAGKAVVKLALGVMLMMAALVAAAVGGDDASLRAAGAAIGGWFTGNDGSFERFPLEASSCPCNEPRAGAIQKP
jgi:hypothetical protein